MKQQVLSGSLGQTDELPRAPRDVARRRAATLQALASGPRSRFRGGRALSRVGKTAKGRGRGLRARDYSVRDLLTRFLPPLSRHTPVRL
jgi:hypothetical protein